MSSDTFAAPLPFFFQVPSLHIFDIFPKNSFFLSPIDHFAFCAVYFLVFLSFVSFSFITVTFQFNSGEALPPYAIGPSGRNREYR